MYSKTLKPEIMSTMLPKDFPADKLSKPQYKVVVEKDVMVTMRGGVQVAVNIYRPDAAGPFPAILAADSYQKDLVDLPLLPIFHMRETNDIEYFVSRGYIFVHSDSRGTGHSPAGQFDLFGQEMQNDLYDLVEWIDAEPWCTGKVGMLGESLLAWSQWFAAVQQPPHLTCILPWDAGADIYRDVAWHGGMMAVGFPTAWHMWEIRGHYQLGWAARDPGFVPPNPEMGKWDMVWNVINHPTYDDFWKLRNPDFSKIQCPVFVVGALHKVGLHLRGVVRGYEEVETPKKMMLIHGLLDGDEMAIYNSPEMQLLMLRWYDHWLKGNDTGFMEEPPVTIFVRGADVYRPESEWPLARTDYRKLYLHPGPSGAVESLNDGRLSWDPPTEADSSFTYSYPDQDWTHFSGGGTAVIEESGVVYGQRRIPTFTSAPLAEDLEISGSIVLVLYASSDQKNTDFFCRLVDQAPDSEQIPGMPPKGITLTRGWLKASHACTRSEELSKPYRPYYLHDDPKPIEPGKIYKYEIEVWPTCNLFKKGHRVRIDVACGDSPALDFGGHYYGIKVGADTYYHDKGRPSHIILPVIPASR
ncbi:MAG: CocE/NonD family hydrolase [bacterium]